MVSLILLDVVSEAYVGMLLASCNYRCNSVSTFRDLPDIPFSKALHQTRMNS